MSGARFTTQKKQFHNENSVTLKILKGELTPLIEGTKGSDQTEPSKYTNYFLSRKSNETCKGKDRWTNIVIKIIMVSILAANEVKRR